MSDEIEPVVIREREGRMPWWGWLLVLGSLVFAFLVGPFNWFSP